MQTFFISQPTPPQTKLRQYWLRTYLLFALPAFIIVALVMIGWAVWQTQQTLIGQIAQEMGFVAFDVTRLTDERPTPAEFDLIFRQVPPSQTGRLLFATEKDGTLIAEAQETPFDRFLIHDERPIASPIAGVGLAYARGVPWLGDYSLFYRWSPEDADYDLIAFIPSTALFTTAFWSILPTLAATVAIVLATAIFIFFADRRRNRLLNQIGQASYAVAQGRINTSIDIESDDELSELGALVDGMRLALKERIDASTLLLEVSQQVAHTIDLNKGMPLILNGLLQGCSADGVRAVVINPSGGRPLLFGAGDAAPRMAALDRRILLQMRNGQSEFVLPTPLQIRARLNFPDEREMLTNGLVAFPLMAQEQLRGVLWLGYNKALQSEPRELNLMRDFANRASSLVANAFLFAQAEGGRRRMAAVLASTTDGVIVVDQTDRFILINEAVESAFGLDAQAMYGRLVEDVVKHPKLLALLTKAVHKVDGQEIAATRLNSPKAENQHTYIASVSKVVGQDKSLMGRVIVLHDITRFKQVEEMKADFVSMLSHDLRNPLAFMHTYASMLPDQGDLNPPQQQSVDNIIHGIERMHTIIGEMLDLSRIESEVHALDIRPINAQTILTRIAKKHQAHAEGVGNHLTVIVSDENLQIHADEWSLNMVLNNLIGNALNYAKNTGEVLISAKPTPSGTLITVQDNGIGISKADQVRIFEKFYRASEPATPDVEGSGLGLAIVKSIAQRHNADLWVESDLGKGTTFSICFPTP